MTAPAPEASPEFLEFAVTLSEEAGERREFVGLALPYNEAITRPDYASGAMFQEWAPGSVVFRDNVQIFYGHDHLNRGLPVGRVIAIEDTPKGPRITASLSRTAKGDEVYTLMKDGVLDRLSVGFWPVASRLSEDGMTLTHTEIDAFEVSVVPDPALKNAAVENVLSNQHHPTPPEEGTNMTESAVLEALPAQVEALSSSIDTLERQLATLGQQAPASNPIPFGSYGEAIQTLAAGDEAALTFFAEMLAYTGGVVGDLDGWVKDTWVGDIIRELQEQRLVLNFFGTSPLPATGMNVEYGKLLADTTQVGEQVAEGDPLLFGKISFETDTAPLKTYGGWGEMSRQQIERSAMQVVERFYRALVRRYKKVTENAVRGIAQTAAGAKAIPGVGLVPDTADEWIDFLVEGAVWLDDKGLTPDGLLVGKDVFKSLAKQRDGVANDAPRLLDRDSGSISVTGLNGDLFSVPVKLVGSFAPGTVRLCSTEAIQTFEQGNAPFRLTDDDVTNLTKAFSIYGYLAVANQEPDAIVVPAV